MKRKPILIALIAASIIVVAGYFGAGALRQPTREDFAQLDTDRKVLDASMNLYNPLITGYSVDYTNVFSEERTSDESQAVKDDYLAMFVRERQINSDRLERMGSSIAVRDEKIKKPFGTFEQRYRAVIDYYDQESKNLTNVISSVAGPCTKLNKLNFAAESAVTDYTKLADACLKALDTAKKTSDGDAKTLLSDVEALIKERRDKFNDVIGKEGTEESGLKMIALVSLLDFNTDLKAIQIKYDTNVQKKYTELVNQANDSNEEFERVLAEVQKGAA